MTEYVIGIDSGGTSTVADAYDVNGKILAHVKAGFGNLLNNQETALKNLRSVVEKIQSELGSKNCQAIIMGVAGIDSGDFKQIIRQTFSHVSAEIVLLNDAWLAHYALLKGKDGCLIISGTGSIAIGRYQEKEARSGGWGNLLGDEGSGYAISKQLIVSVLDAYDENRRYSSLEQKLLEEYGFETVFELVKFVYSSSKDQVAQMASFIAEAAENNDLQALSILEQAGQDLGLLALKLIHKLEMENNINIAITGNVLVKNEYVFRSFKEKILENIKEVQFIRSEQANTVGAYYYFYKER